MGPGDRMLYQGEPVYIVEIRNVRAKDDSGWVLVQFADGTGRYVLPGDLQPAPEK